MQNISWTPYIHLGHHREEPGGDSQLGQRGARQQGHYNGHSLGLLPPDPDPVSECRPPPLHPDGAQPLHLHLIITSHGSCIVLL